MDSLLLLRIALVLRVAFRWELLGHLFHLVLAVEVVLARQALVKVVLVHLEVVPRLPVLVHSVLALQVILLVLVAYIAHLVLLVLVWLAVLLLVTLQFNLFLKY